MRDDPCAFLREHAGWLFDAKLGVCIVGSSALAIACARAAVAVPAVADLDISWALDLEAGEALLRRHKVFRATTEHNRNRGTLAMKIGGERIEVTTFRGGASASSMRERITEDLSGRDMTVGALAFWLAEDTVLDPFDGLEDWVARRVVPVGDPNDRIREHAIRWIRYYRRAHQWGFDLDLSIRKVDLDRSAIHEAPAEAIAAELRSSLADCASPGRFLLELHECGLLTEIAPELATQFDGRPAGPVRYHPEVSQALHLILALEWIAERAVALDARDRNRVTFAVLCHDLGKGLTPSDAWPAHHGHEDAGVEPLMSLCDRLPGLTDSRGRRFAEAVCRLHLVVRTLPDLRSGTRAKLYDRYFRDQHIDARLFALAVGADSGGRLRRAEAGDAIAVSVEADINWMRERCDTVDVEQLWKAHKSDQDRFTSELHQAWARKLSASPPSGLASE